MQGTLTPYLRVVQEEVNAPQLVDELSHRQKHQYWNEGGIPDAATNFCYNQASNPQDVMGKKIIMVPDQYHTKQVTGYPDRNILHVELGA